MNIEMGLTERWIVMYLSRSTLNEDVHDNTDTVVTLAYHPQCQIKSTHKSKHDAATAISTSSF